MESSDDDTLSERSCVSEPSFRSERSGGSLSPCTSGLVGPPGDTLPWNLSKHERKKRKSQDSVLDPAERAVVRVADERDRVQKKTFTKWVNKHLIKVRKHITDLYEDLRDGHNLISLLEVLSGVTLPREKGRMRFHRLQNVQIALDFLKQRQVKLVNIRNDDITDGNPKLTLGLIWTIILHFQISEIYVCGESADLTAKEKLLLWSQQAIEGYPGLRCVNFTSSWSDGRMFNALLHRYRPDLIDMEVVSRQSNRENLEQAFEIAESLGVTRLLDAEDVDVPSPDEKSVITYVSSIYDAFPKIPEGGEGIGAHEVDQRWSEYQSRFSSLLQWSRQHTALMANKNFPQNPVELKALYNEYVHFKETEIPAKEIEKGHIEHLYKLLEVWIEFGRIKLPQGLHPNDLEEDWGKLILEMLEREKVLRPAVERLDLLLQRANKIQNMSLDCEEKLTLAKNTLQADMSRAESGEGVQCERELACYLQDCESLIQQLYQELKILRDEKYYQVEQLVFRVSRLQEELVSLRLQCSSVYRKGHFSQALGTTGTEHTHQRPPDTGLSLGQTLLGAVGAVGAALLRRPMARSQLVAMSSSEDEGSLRFIYELLGWVEETQELLERAEWGADLTSVEKNLDEHNNIHTAIEELMNSLQEARSYEAKVSPNFKSSYSETLAKLENQYCKLLEHSSWRLRSLESLHMFVSQCTDELIWLNEREEEEIAYDWSDNNTNTNAKKELYSEMRLELDEKRDVMRSLQETASRLCQENHPAKQTVEAYSAALQTQWQWVDQLCLCVEQHLKDNTAYFQFMTDARDCESYLRQLQETIKRQYTCDKNSRLSKLEDLLQDSMEEKEQLIEYRSTVASLVGRAKTVVQLRPRSAESTLGTTTPIKAICDYKQIEITISRGEECVLQDNSQRTKWKVISPTGNEAMVPSVCFTVPPPNQEAIDTASRAEQLYQKVMSLWHQLHVNMKSVVSWHYLLKDIKTVSGWNLDTVRSSPCKLQSELDSLRSSLGDVSHRCVKFFEEKPTSSSVPVLRSELNHAVEKMDKLHNLSAVYLEKLKTVDVLIRSLDEAESQVRKYENRLSEEDIVPADTTAIQNLRDQLGVRVFQSLQVEVRQAKEAGSKLNRLHPDRSPELERYQDKANQITERWSGIKRQMETRRADLEALGSSLQQYRDGHSALIKWIEETTERQENTQPGQMDSKALSEQLAQQTALVAEIEQNQTKLDECQTHSKQYCASVKDYELQLMTFRAFVESMHKSPVKRRRMHSSSDAITQEFMDLRTRYTALVTLTTQHVKYISDALRRLEEEEKEVEEEKQARVGQVSDLLGWVKGLQGRVVMLSNRFFICFFLQAINEQLAAKKDQVAEAIRSTQVFLLSKQASKLSPEERAHVEAQLDELKTTYNQLCDSSTQQLQQLEQQLAKEEERKNEIAIAGVIDLSTVETFPVFPAAQRGLIDQDTCHVLLETQLIMGGLLQPDSPVKLSLEQALTRGLIDSHTRQSLSELESALYLVENTKTVSDEQQENALPIVIAMETGLIREEVGLRILQLQMNTGGLRHSTGKMLSLEQAEDKRLLSPRIITKLQSRLQHRELIDPNTAEKVNLCELQLQCVLDDDSGLLLFPVKQQPGGTVCLRSGRKVGIFRAVQEGLIDRKVTVRLLEAQLFAGGIADPRSGHRLTVDEAVRHGLMDQDLACAMLARQLQNGGILDPFSGERLDLEESIRRDLLSPRLALLVLESLWTFMGLLWPETGEVLPIAEAVQQGVISGDLARSTLRQRHAIGALYNPETLQVWGSTSSSSPPSSPLPPSSPTGLVWETTSTNGKDPEEQAKHKLLFHLMTHSYVDAHSGKRLVLLDPELMIMIKDADMVAGESARQVEPLSSVATDKLDKLEMGEKISLAGNGVSEGVNDSSSLVTPSKDFEINDRSGLEEMHDGEGNNKSLQQPSEPIEEDLAISAKYEIAGDKRGKVDEQKKEMTSWDRLASAKYLNDEITKSPNEIIQTEYQPMDSPVRDSGSTTATEVIEMATAPLKSEDNVERKTFKELVPGEKPNEDVKLTASQERKGIKDSQAESEIIKQNVAVKETDSKQAKPQVDISEAVVEKQEEDAELERMVMQLKQGGLMTEEGEKLLPDEAVAQGVLPGHTAVKLMAQAGLFGGFLDAISGESLTMEEVMQEGLLDEDLMWGVLKSDKTLAGVVDVEKRQICGVREAAQAGLIDPNTASRLLEAQVASGGIVDLRRDKKVSVTLAANLGLIEDDHREELVALEKACKGKDADSSTFLKKASLQLQMEGVLDPESKSPVPIEQAIHKGLIRPEEAYQVLARQVAEGGIIHHPSGMRLPVSDAVDRGLVDRSVAPGLEELEWVYQGKVSPSHRPEAFVFQASTGAISDPDTGIKLTLTEAVTKGLLDKNKASEVMASPTVTQGVLDPQTARIVPYSELVNQGKIDIETGKRFLEVKPFRGVQDKQSKETLTLPEAVALKKVDPAPAFRLLQSQADSGGIIDIRTGERLSLPEASKRGLVGDDMVTEIATNQFLKGGLVDPSTGQRVSGLNVATALGLISNNVALEIQEKVMSVETEGGEESSTPVASSDSTTDEKFEVESNLVRQGQKEALKPIAEPEKEANKILTATAKADKREEMKGKSEEKDSVAQQPEKPESIQEVKERKEHELPQKSPLPDTEKAALILKAKESILKKVFEKGVSEKQAAEELQALRKEVGKKEGKGITVSDVKAQTRHAKEDGVESRAVKEDTVKTSDGLSEESKEEEMSVKVDKMKLREVKENLPVEKPLVEETTEAEPLEVSSNEKEKDATFGMEETQKDIKTAASVQSKEAQPSKQSKKSKRSKRLKVAEKAEPDTEKALSKEKVEVTATEITPKSTLERTDLESSGLIQEQKVDSESRSLTRDVLSPSAGEETVEVETPAIIIPTVETLELTSPQRPSYHVQDIVQAEEISGGKDKSHSGTGGVIEADLSHDGHKVETQSTALSAALSTAQPTASDPQPDKTAGKGRKKKKHQPVKEEGTDTPASESLKNQQQHLESSETPALLSEDAAADPSVGQSIFKVCFVFFPQSSLMRQECLEHDQRMVALLSMVRHIEVQLKQQQQQSVGRSLITLEDIIRQTETLDLELRDMEPEINKEAEAAERLLKPQPKNVPPQLLLALEKDGRSLARGYEAARALSEGILQTFICLCETFLQELQSSLMARSSEVNNVVFDIQVFISERAQDLAPEQSRHLLGQLQQLQKAFHRASGQAQAWADALSAQRDREEERQRKEKEKEEEKEKERQSARERESFKSLIFNGIFLFLCFCLQEVQKDLHTKGEGIAEAIRSVEELLSEQGETLSPEERENLQAALTRMKEQYSALTDSTSTTLSELDTAINNTVQQNTQRVRAAMWSYICQNFKNPLDRLRKSEALKDELTKFLQEHGSLGTWLEQSERDLRSLGEGETDAQGLKGRLDEHRKLAEDVICHKADLRFVSISGQKVLDSVQGALEQGGGSDASLESTKQLVTDNLQDANHRYTTLHTKSTELGSRLSGLLERYQQYQDEVVSLHSWLSTQEQNQSIAKASAETDPQNLQNTLRQVQVKHAMTNTCINEHKMTEKREIMQLRHIQKHGLVCSLHSIAVYHSLYLDGLEKRFDSLSTSVSERAEQLQTAVAQSVSVQEGLKGLLSWLDKLALSPGPIEPTAQAKLRQELLSRQGSVDATRDSVSKLLHTSDASTASGLQGSLEDLTQRFTAAQASQAEREAELKGLLPKLESYERLGSDLQVFTQSRVKALSPVGQPDRSVDDYRQTIEVSRVDRFSLIGQTFPALVLRTFSGLCLRLVFFTLSSSFLIVCFSTHRFAAIQACEQQLLQFRGLSSSLVRWLQTAQDQLPSKEANLNTEGLQRRVQQLKDLLHDWESQGSRVQELNKTGSELESLIIDITAPQTKTGAPHINGSAGPSSVNGIHTCKDLTELQVAVSDVNSRYDALGGELKERLGQQQASLELRQKARQGTEELKSWLTDREESLKQAQTASPSKPEVVRAQAQENKALLSELAEHSGKVEELKSTLRKLIAENPDSPEADTWRQQLQEIDSRWQTANQTAAQRQTELETCADRLGSFASAANQLGPWLREKELMMSVLGPLSIDPNMLNTQKQQAQFMLREFETRRPQFDQLTQSAEGILSQTGDSAQDPKDLAEVRSELGSISQQWEDLTSKLTQRSNHIDQAQGTSERYQALLRDLSSSLSALSERLDAQASLSAQPEALKRRLQETGEIRSVLERRRTELAEAEKLCQELSAIVAEPYLKEELSKRLEGVSGPLKSLEERAADGLSQLQAALSSTQQFQQMFEELRSWLDKQTDPRESSTVALPCQPEAIRSLLAETDELQRGIASQRGSYELIQAEGASLLATLPVDERSALQARLTSLRQDWEGLNHRISDREARLKNTLNKAETYQQHKAELVPWLADCEGKEKELQPSLDSSALDEASQKARNLSLDIERRQPLLEAFNAASDQLLEQCCIGEEEVRDEKAQLNRRVDGLGESLHNRTAQLEELASRLKEFEEGRQAVERRLEAAKHQIEVQEALGPQACSAKSLERLRSQQESLRSLQPQVVYLRDLAQGLVQDAPQTPGGSTEGTRRLQEQAKDAEKEYEDVTDKVGSRCCSSLESRLQGVGEVQAHVRDVFSRLADLDDELDSFSPVGRDADSLASQADALKGFLSRLANLRTELEGHASECTTMLRREGSSPDLLALRRETEALSRQAGKLSERGQARLDQIEDAADRVRDFYRLVAELQGLLGRAEENLNAQGLVGTEVEMIKQQLQEFKAVEREQVDSIQPKLQHVNAVGQGLIQSAAKHTDTQALEHDLETTNLQWNSLNKRVAERIAQLQEALLHCGKFQDALEPLLSWLSDTEELVANQKPPSAEYRVVKAQIQEQKLLQRLLDDRRPTVDMIQAEGERIAATADSQDREKIQTQLQSLAERWSDLLDKASGRQRQLEELQVLALQFHEALEPLGEWLSTTERRLSSAEPMGTQTAKITQQIVKHKALNEEILSRKKTVDQAIKNGQALLKQTTGEEVLLIQEKLDGIKSRYAEMTAGSSKALRTLEQALQLSTRFASAHDDLNQWLDGVETELNTVEPDASPAYQERQKELKKVSAEKRLVLDTVNEVGSALLDLVPWRAREGLDRLVADANQRYRQSDETITQRVQLVQAAIQRSQQYEEAVDAELAWVGETERKLASLGPLSLEPDVTVAQLQVQRAFNIDIIRHKDTVDQLLSTRDDILEACSDAQKDALMLKTGSLSARYDAVSQSHSERFSALEQAQVLVARFWETCEELEPWLGETETLIAQLPPPAIDTDALRLQQDQMRLLRESIAEHKPHIDKLLKIGPQLAELSLQEGASVTQRYADAEKRYQAIKEEVKGRATVLDEAVSQSAQFHDKMDPLLETLEGAVQRLRQPPPVAAEVEKIREQLAEHRAQGLELDKLLPSFSALCARGEELIGRAAHDDPAAQAVRSRLLRLRSLWDEIRQRAEEREGKLNDVLDLAGKFWADVAALLSTLRDSQDIVKDLEDPGVDPSLIKQQIEAAEAIKAETDGLREELEFVRTLGADLIFACGETEKPEVKKTIDEMNAAWEGLNRTWRERMERLEEAMTASVQYQDALQSMFDYLDNAVIKLCEMSTVGTDLGTVKQQIEELKQYKVEVYQQQIDMEKLSHQGELLLKKVSDQTDRDMIQEPLTELRHLWENLGDKITQRQHKLEAALLALGQFQHALSELQAWLTHTHTTLDTQRPVSSDPKAIEIELAKHHVLRNDVLSHHATVDTVNNAAAELLESSPGDEAGNLRDQLDQLNQSWGSLLLKTQERQKLLEAALQQAEGFHGELEEFLQWLRRTESQLSAAKPTGGLPETAREQLQQHMELQAQVTLRGEQYNRLLDQGESMLLARGGEEAGPGTTQTQQNLAMLQNKWGSLNTKMDDRRAKLDEAVSLATGFQTSLQDTINWLTQAEQTLNMAQPPSLILDTVLFQIDEHKVFVNEVNTHREQVLALEKAGSQLRFASLKQDVVLIKNLLLSVQARWDKLVQRSLDRGRHLDEARKRAKQFHEAWRKLTDWLEEAEKRLDSELEISNEPDKIKVQLTKHKEFQKALGSKQPVYDTTVRSGRAMRDKAQLPADTQKLDNLLGEVRDKWDTVCGKSVERQHKLEEALLFSGQFAEALQALVDWLYRVEPQLAEDQPVHGDLDLVSNLMDSHKAFQKELGKRTSSVQALKRSARDLMETGRDDTAWVKVQLQELSNRWDTVCALSVTKQTRLQQALKQAEDFRTAVQLLLEWLSEAEQTLRFRGVLPEEAETLQALLHTHRDFMGTVEEKRTDVNKAAGMGEGILTVCHPDSITTIKHWITIIRARFEEVLTWAKQHEQRLETALTEVLNNANLLEELLSWLQWAETTLVQRDTEPLPQDIPQLKNLITEHQMFMEEMTRKQPDVDKVTKTYKRKPAEPPSSLAERRGARKSPQQQQQAAMQVSGGNPRLNQLCARWQQVWLLALDRQRKLNDALDRLEELKEFANFDFDVWRKKYMRWMNHKKSRVMDFFRRIDKDQDGKITRQEFIDGILASKFPTSKLEMTAVADIFDRDGDGYIDYYEFVAALHPNKDAYRPTTDADKIEDEVTRQVAQCKCAKRFQVEQIGENKYRFFLGNQFGDSQQLRLVRILRSTVMVRVGGGWMALDEFLVKNDPCRARGRTNLELREKFILPEGASQGLAAFRSRGRRSKPGSRNASPTRSSSSASHSGASLPSAPSAPATPTASGAPSGSKLKRPTFHSSRGSLTGENGGTTHTSKPSRTGETPAMCPGGSTASGPTSRAGSRAGSRASSRRGSDASDASELQDARSVCSDTSDTPRRPGSGAKPSKIPTISKKTPSPKTPGSAKK
uniref:Microtubule actin crosslinking factor 1 n=1 Tax=Astatotilapia calliptera TaxID=8154 RepID=A0AAX7UQ45_ASTCA